ncbi:hypothetical protein GCM10020358_70030 [Amorphoplanes nipponensis]|uniref:Tat (Twin-arginine translocation) pathway signal sequence n=1 Tax=Actinoplanes nipponensis TaxID=135950 RepID=A0A919JQK6_9ACTN|nr:hypothetical protein [Actinoplanes nipponensis]GIE51129.1 hypothetical protein Ani05nite_46630 [Actinoplanes nipponensis]
MRLPAGLSRSAGHSGGALAVLAAALAVAFVVAPRPLAALGPGGGFADRRELAGALRGAFAEYWRAGDRRFAPGLERVVDYWFRYHVAKAVIAALLLAVLVALGVRLGQAFLRAGGLGAGRRAALAAAGFLVTALTLFATAVLMANIQGAAAPFASLLPMLPDDATAEQIRQRLAGATSGGGPTPPALDAMISDFARYHLALALVAALVAVVLAGAGVVVWRRSARAGTDRRMRRLLRSFGVLAGVMSVLVIVIAAANTGTAADPAPALLAFFTGSW